MHVLNFSNKKCGPWCYSAFHVTKKPFLVEKLLYKQMVHFWKVLKTFD